MSRNRYDDAFGVVRVRWHKGAPSETSYPVLCEVWAPSLHIDWEPDTKPRVTIRAQLEMRLFKDGAWFRIGHNATLRPVDPEGEVRRHARIGAARIWASTITLDSWSKE